MLNLLKINDGTPRNTKEKKGVPTKKRPTLVCELYIYIYGTLEHRNTTHDKSRTNQFVRFFLIVLNFQIFKFIKPVFRCSLCSIIDTQRLRCVPTVFHSVFHPVFFGEKWT